MIAAAIVAHTVVVPVSGQTQSVRTLEPVIATVPAALYPIKFALSFIVFRSYV